MRQLPWLFLSWFDAACRMDADASGAASWNTVLAAASPAVVHGAWSDELETEKPDSGKMRSWCLYAPTTGKTLPNGLPDRIDWVAQRSASETSPWIVYGHQPYQEARIENRTAGIDTSCVFGGKLTALRWPEMELVSVQAKKQYDTHPTAGGGGE